jgi:hypothetical protein
LSPGHAPANPTSCLANLGRHQEALGAINQAATVRRERAARWPDAHRHERKLPGKTSDRPERHPASTTGPGDTLVVARLDRPSCFMADPMQMVGTLRDTVSASRACTGTRHRGPAVGWSSTFSSRWRSLSAN